MLPAGQLHLISVVRDFLTPTYAEHLKMLENNVLPFSVMPIYLINWRLYILLYVFLTKDSRGIITTEYFATVAF